MKHIFMFVLLFIIGYSKEYMIDISHSSVSFAIKHLSVADTIGVFREFDGKLFIDNNKITKLVGNVKLSSIDTQNEARDEELKTKDFFSTNEAKLESLYFKNNVLYSNLTINGIKKEVQFKVKITGPIRNPSLDKNKMQQNKNPFNATDIPNNPLTMNKDSDLDCGCYVSYGDNVVGVELKGSINRFDFNISPKTPKELLGEYADIKIILEASN